MANCSIFSMLGSMPELLKNKYVMNLLQVVKTRKQEEFFMNGVRTEAGSLAYLYQ